MHARLEDAYYELKPGHPESPNFLDPEEAEEAGGQAGGQRVGTEGGDRGWVVRVVDREWHD